ncbi:translation initiation factor IF-2-like [Cervus canadensis]|uniref:translation initiation factor IF-2-like n=1 Tax=Cervus canadensis TaxID=1574408 RepID=UPI001C9E806B|nr:translation initiation factor IF-2-like [Cervus canadensis]
MGGGAPGARARPPPAAGWPGGRALRRQRRRQRPGARLRGAASAPGPRPAEVSGRRYGGRDAGAGTRRRRRRPAGSSSQVRRRPRPAIGAAAPGAGRGPGLTTRWGGWGCAEARAPRPPFWRPAGWAGADVRGRPAPVTGEEPTLLAPAAGRSAGTRQASRPLRSARRGVCSQAAPSSRRGRPGTPRLPVHENRFIIYFYFFLSAFPRARPGPRHPELPRARFPLWTRPHGGLEELGQRRGPGPRVLVGGVGRPRRGPPSLTLV